MSICFEFARVPLGETRVAFARSTTVSGRPTTHGPGSCVASELQHPLLEVSDVIRSVQRLLVTGAAGTEELLRTHLTAEVDPHVGVVKQVDVRRMTGFPVRTDLVTVVRQTMGAGTVRRRLGVDEPPQVVRRVSRWWLSVGVGCIHRTRGGGAQLDYLVLSLSRAKVTEDSATSRG